MEIEKMLDLLPEYEAERDMLKLQKQELLNAVVVPAEIQELHEEGVKRKQAIARERGAQWQILDAEKTERLAAIVIPDEIKAALAEIDAKRNQIIDEIEARKQAAFDNELKRLRQVDDEFAPKVNTVYSQVATRRQEISAEFDGKTKTADEKIAELTAEIKKAVVSLGRTVKGTIYQAVYVKGRITWNTDMLDGLIVAFPQLAKARKEGAPSVTLRKV